MKCTTKLKKHTINVVLIVLVNIIFTKEYFMCRYFYGWEKIKVKKVECEV